MKKLDKLHCILIVLIILLGSISFYEYTKINSYKDNLQGIVTRKIQTFAGKSGNIEDEVIFAQQYGDIIAAHEAYVVLTDGSGIPSDEWDSNLAALLLSIKDLMLNDKEKFNKVFTNTEAASLMLNISNNLDDKESIKKVNDLLQQ